MASHCEQEFVTKFVVAQHGRYNFLRLQNKSGSRSAPAVGVVEIEDAPDGSFICRLDLTVYDLFVGDTSEGHMVAGFMRLSEGADSLESDGDALLGEVKVVFAAALADNELDLLEREIAVEVNARRGGCTLVGVLSGSLPDDFAPAPGAGFEVVLLGVANGYGRFIAEFAGSVDLDDITLTVASDDWRTCIRAPAVVDLLIPAHSTITIDWSRHDVEGRLRRERDVMTDVILGIGQSTDLSFRLFEPGVQPVLSAVILAEELGTNARITYRYRQDEGSSSGPVHIDSVIEGAPNRFVLVDMVVASRDPARANPAIKGMCFFGKAAAGAFPICCATKGGPNTPASQPVLSNPPGGAGGVPEEPAPQAPGPSTPGPNSSTSDGGNTCDANYGVVLPPSGRLTLSTTVLPVEDERPEIALVGVFDGNHKIAHGRAALRRTDGGEDPRRFNPAWLVERGVHLLLVDAPRGRSLRRADTIKIAVDTRDRLVNSITLRKPRFADIRAGAPVVLGDLGAGLGFDVRSSRFGPRGVEIELHNASGGWIGAPATVMDGAEVRLTGAAGAPEHLAVDLCASMRLFGILYRSMFLAEGVERVLIERPKG